MEPEAPPEPPKGGVLRGVVFKTVDISVPHGRAPGSRLVVQAEGRLVTAVIPEGARPGDVFPIHVPIELTKVCFVACACSLLRLLVAGHPLLLLLLLLL
jgi:hypothetical protein